MKNTIHLVTKLVVTSLVALILCNCTPQAHSNLGASTHTGLSLPQIAEVPILAQANSRELYVPITNHSSQAIELINYTLGQTVVTSLGKCQVVQPGKSCLLKISIAPENAQDAGSLAFTIAGKDSQQQYTAQTIIAYHVIKDIAGLVLPRQISYDPNSQRTNGYLLIPLIMENTMQNPQISIAPGNHKSQLFCNSAGDTQECSLIADLSQVAATAKSLQLAISNPQVLNLSYQATIEISLTQGGNLVVGGLPLIIAPANSSSKKTVTLLNNGNSPLTLTGFTVPAPLDYESNTCSTTLAAGDSCTLQLKANTLNSGSQVVTFDYTSNNEAKSVSFTAAYYPSNNLQPNILAYGSANFDNIIIGTTISGVYTLYNASLVPVIYHGLSNVTRQNAAFSENLSYSDPTKCVPEQILASGQWCTIQINYQPLSKISGNLAIVPVFSYTNSVGELLTYSKQVALTPYSSGNLAYLFLASLTSSMRTYIGRCTINANGTLSSCTKIEIYYDVEDSRQTRSFLKVTESSMYVGFDFGNNNPVIYATFTSNGTKTGLKGARILYTGAVGSSTLKLNAAGDSRIYGMGIYESWLYLANRSNRNANDIQIARCNFSTADDGELTNCIGFKKSQLEPLGIDNYGEILAFTIYKGKIYVSTTAAGANPNKVYACQLEASGNFSGCSPLIMRDQSGESASVQLRLRTIQNDVAYLVSFTDNKIWICNINDLDHCKSYSSTNNNINKVQSVIPYGQKLYVIKENTSSNVRIFDLDQDGFITNFESGIDYTISGSYSPVFGITMAF